LIGVRVREEKKIDREREDQIGLLEGEREKKKPYTVQEGERRL